MGLLDNNTLASGLLNKDPLGAVTSNRNMLAQALKARQTTPRNALTGQGLLDTAAIGLSPVPVIGDAIGLAADASRFYNEPESRTPLNFGLAALGLLPFVPAAGAAAGLWKGSAGPAMGGNQLGAVGDVSKAPKSIPDYQGLHKPPMKDSGAPLHDLTGGGKVYPDDVYGPNGLRYYGTGEGAIDREAYNIAMYAKGRPDRPVKMYRAVPYEPTVSEQIAALEKQKAKFMARGIVPPEFGGGRNSLGDGDGFYDYVSKEIDRLKSLPETPKQKLSINHGDWVTTSRNYAKEHGEGTLQGKYKILSKTVPARKLYTNGDSWAEYGYDETGKIAPELLSILAGGGLLGLGAYKYGQGSDEKK